MFMGSRIPNDIVDLLNRIDETKNFLSRLEKTAEYHSKCTQQ